MGRSAVYSEHTGLVDCSSCCDRITKSVIEKTTKLNSGYKVFKNNWLYIFANTSMLKEYDIKKMIKSWEFEGEFSFNKIIINGLDVLFIVDDNEVEIINIDDEVLKSLKIGAIEKSGKQ